MPLTGEALIRVQGDVTNALSALRQLDTSLKGTTQATDKLKAGTAQTADSMGKFKTGVGSVVQQLTGFNLASLSAAGGVALVGKTIIDSVRGVMQYNKEILDGSRATRMTTSELSRLVQVADDVGIEMNSVTRALELATKNGFAPSVGAIADLADKTNAMNSPTDRAAYLAKILGRNWAELNPLLELGGDRIREMASAVDKGLVATEKEIKYTEELRYALDELGDTWKATKNELGMTFIVPFVDQMKEAERYAELQTDALELLRTRGITPTRDALASAAQELIRLGVTGEGASGAIELLRLKLGKVETGLDNIATAADDAGEAVKDAFTEATEATVAAYLKDQEYKAGIDDIAAAIAVLRNKHVVITITTITEEIERQTWQWRQSLATGVGSGAQRARGGPLADITEVGEAGTEGIIGDTVIPHEQWEAMKRVGVVPAQHARLGSEVESGGLDYMPSSSKPWLRPTTTKSGESIMTWIQHASRSSHGLIGSMKSLSEGAAGAALVQSSAAAAAEAAAMRVATAMPQAISQGVSQQTSQQVQMQVANNAVLGLKLDAIRREVAMLNQTIARTVRDAVAAL